MTDNAAVAQAKVKLAEAAATLADLLGVAVCYQIGNNSSASAEPSNPEEK